MCPCGFRGTSRAVLSHINLTGHTKVAVRAKAKPEAINHPAHYGGADNVYEAIKVIDAWGLGFSLGNAVKYIARAGRKGDRLEDLEKARFYLDHEIALAEGKKS